MPNWCNNVVTLMHDEPEKLKEVAKAFDDEKLFAHFVPVAEESVYTQSEAWGTKWDVGGDVIDLSDDGITLSFDSAWSPPIAFYEAMEKLGFSVEASFCEWGMEFVGRYVDGELEEYGFDDMPSELDEEWGISETREMWEEENESEDD